MMRFLMTLALSAGMLSGAEAADDGFVTRLIGAPPGAGATYACFARAWDKAHLAAQPRESVKAMRLLAVLAPDDPDSLDMRIDGELSPTGRQFETIGTCGAKASPDAAGGLTVQCGVDCDGGSFSVTLQRDGSVLIADDDAIRDWAPAQTTEAGVDKGLGEDDTRFRLARAKLSQCTNLSASGEEKAILSKNK